MLPCEHPVSESTVLRAKLAGLRLLAAAIRLQHLLRKANFNPGQLRDEIGRWTSEGGSGRPDPTQGTGRSGYRVDLLEEQQRGGHPIERHVGKSETTLLAGVLRTQAELLAAGADNTSVRGGSFSSLEAANKLVNSTLAQHQARVEDVARGRKASDFLSATFGSPTGSEAFAKTLRSGPYIRPTYGVGVFIRHDPGAKNGFTVITAYPLND